MNWGLIGHTWAVNLLKKHLQSGRIRHAYLFTGSESVGKRTLALRFAKALNCREAPEPGQFCGECRACKLVDLEQYPDLHVVESQEDTQELHVDQVRELQRQLALTPVESRWRVALLPSFEEAVASSQASAANALLKTLEEPPPHVILLLTAPSKEALLPTVVSRCEVIPLRAVPYEVIERGLLERGISPEMASLFASVSAGRPGAAIELAKNPVEVERRASLLEDFAYLLGMKRADRFDYIENMLRSNDYQGSREKALQSLELWSTLWRDAMVLHCHAELKVHHPDSMEMLNGMAALERREILTALLAIRDTITAVRRYANTRLAMEVVVLSMPYLKL
jgi:DNA polymerase-3 subunit delta'